MIYRSILLALVSFFLFMPNQVAAKSLSGISIEIRGQYKAQLCLTNSRGSCTWSDLSTVHHRVYIGKKGKIFDYFKGSNSEGILTRNGGSITRNSTTFSYKLSGKVLKIVSKPEQPVSFTDTIRIKSKSRCSWKRTAVFHSRTVKVKRNKSKIVKCQISNGNVFAR